MKELHSGNDMLFVDKKIRLIKNPHTPQQQELNQFKKFQNK